MEINGGQYPNPNGSPIWPGTQFQGPLLAGNIPHGDGSGNLASFGEYSGSTANAGYVVMAQTAVVNALSSIFTTPIVIPAQSQILAMTMMVTTAQSANSYGVGDSVTPTAFTLLATGATTPIGQNAGTLVPTTAGQVANWDNVGNTDVQITLNFTTTGAFIGTLTVTYIQGINNAS
jgi:hypothetical protein